MSTSYGDQRTTSGQPVTYSRQQVQSGVAEGQGPSGWMLFAALMLMISGAFNVIDGLVGFFRSTYYVGRPVGGDLWIYALMWLAFGVLLVAAGSAILAGRSWARWFGIVIVSLNAFLNLFAIGVYPWWSLTMIAVDILVLWGLSVGWRRPAVA